MATDLSDVDGPSIVHAVAPDLLEHVAIDRLLFATGRYIELDLAHGANRLPPPTRFAEVLHTSCTWPGSIAEYSCPLGPAPLREAIARYESIAGQREVSVENVVVTDGGAEALALAFRHHAAKGGRRCLIGSLQFPVVFASARAAGLEIVQVLPQSPTEPLSPDHLIEAIKRSRPTVVALSQPGNPGGDLYTDAEILRVFCAIADVGAVGLIDKVASDIGTAYLKPVPPLQRLAEAAAIKLYVVDSMSKRRSCPGCRLGYLIARPDVTRWADQVLVGRSSSRSAEEAAILDLELTAGWLEGPARVSMGTHQYISEIASIHRAMRSNYERIPRVLGSRLIDLGVYESGKNCTTEVHLDTPVSDGEIVESLLTGWHLGSYPTSCFSVARSSGPNSTFRARITLSTPEDEFARALERFARALDVLAPSV